MEADEYCEQPADEDQELTFDEDGNLIPPQIARRRAKRTSGQAKKGRPALPGSFLQTAADLSSSPPVDSGGSVPPHSSGPSAVKPGVFVRHPAHGVGIVKEVFGPSIDRIALVEFLTGSGTTEIPLSDPDLKTIQKRK